MHERIVPTRESKRNGVASPTIRLLIGDDHPVIREGIKQMVGDTGDIVVAGEAIDAREVLDRVRGGRWDALILDLSLPGASGLDLLKTIKKECPALPILVLSIHPEDQFAVRALRSGAAGYLTKEIASAELVAAVRKIAAGGTYVSSRFAEKLAAELGRGADKAPHERLSDREFEVMRLIAAGKSTRDIARELSLSVKTIGTHRARILDKMGLRTTGELIAYAIRHDLA